MKICGVICELNPFHFGHERIFKKARAITGADYIIAVMSGDFVQRGLPAICDKYTRTKMALLGGADIVIELPAIYATASADYFAHGAVSILDSLGCVDYLCFGSESGDIDYLKKYVKKCFSYDNEAHILGHNNYSNNKYRQEVSEYIREGNSYSKAMANASGLTLDSNDVLAACYLKSLKILQSDIEPVTITRSGSSYLDEGENSDSAGAIRRKIKEGANIRSLLPDYSYNCLEEAEMDSCPVYIDDFSIQLYTRIDSIINSEADKDVNLADYMDVSNNIAGRIRANISSYTTYSEFVSLIHSKEYTKSRVMRALLHILLDIKKSDYEDDIGDNVSVYARILGFKRASSNVLGIIKEHSVIPVISKARDAINILDEESLKVYNIDIHCSNMYEQECAFKFARHPQHDFSQEIVIV